MADLIERSAAIDKMCGDCTGFGWGECKGAKESDPACKDFELKPKRTNADKIRGMTDEELAEMLDIYTVDEICQYCKYYGDLACNNRCYEGITAWLKQEAKDDAEAKP